MISFTKTALASALLMTTDLGVSAKTVQTKYTTAGYDAYAYASFDGDSCAGYGNYFYLGAFSRATKFTTPVQGNAESNTFDELYVGLEKASCDGTKVTKQYGYFSDYSDYGGKVATKFTIDTKKLTGASVTGIRVPIYGNTCSYECMEVCYPEIFDYGTCPETEPAYLSCYTTECGEEQDFGEAKVSVTWKVPAGTNTPPDPSRSSYSFSYGGSSYSSKSKGSSRYDVPITITATLNGANLFSSSPLYPSGQLSSTTSKDVSKSS